MNTLPVVLQTLAGLAPLPLAASWDNVGLLVEGRPAIQHIHCTIDLTEAVLSEGLELGADLFMAYHPPIFRGLKRLDRSVPHTRVLLDAIRSGVSIYSPHTALDAVPGGMNDWLVDGLDPQAVRTPIEPDSTDPGAGVGRLAQLSQPLSMQEIIARLKRHLGLAQLRVAGPSSDRMVRTVAVCPGAGESVFEKLSDVDLFLTGEMRHHYILARAARGSSVILTDHTNTERGYLPIFARQLSQALNIPVSVSAVDRDPLAIV